MVLEPVGHLLATNSGAPIGVPRTMNPRWVRSRSPRQTSSPREAIQEDGRSVEDFVLTQFSDDPSESFDVGSDEVKHGPCSLRPADDVKIIRVCCYKLIIVELCCGRGKGSVLPQNLQGGAKASPCSHPSPFTISWRCPCSCHPTKGISTRAGVDGAHER